MISQGFEPDITFSTKKALQFTLSVFFKDEFIFNYGNQQALRGQ